LNESFQIVSDPNSYGFVDSEGKPASNHYADDGNISALWRLGREACASSEMEDRADF